MISEDRLVGIDLRIAATSGSSWKLERASSGAPEIWVWSDDGTHQTLRVTRENEPASLADLTFIVGAHREIARLAGAARGLAHISEDELLILERSCHEASPGPWKVFLEDDGGVGGTNVIWVSDREDQPDMYLWLDDELAPNGDFEFVAEARQDLPALIAAIRGKCDAG